MGGFHHRHPRVHPCINHLHQISPRPRVLKGPPRGTKVRRVGLLPPNESLGHCHDDAPCRGMVIHRAVLLSPAPIGPHVSPRLAALVHGITDAEKPELSIDDIHARGLNARVCRLLFCGMSQPFFISWYLPFVSFIGPPRGPREPRARPPPLPPHDSGLSP